MPISISFVGRSKLEAEVADRARARLVVQADCCMFAQCARSGGSPARARQAAASLRPAGSRDGRPAPHIPQGERRQVECEVLVV